MNKTITVTIIGESSGIDKIMQTLKRMQYDGNVGHSEFVGMFVDGDGDFRPIVKAYEGCHVSALEKEIKVEVGTSFKMDESLVRHLMRGTFY